MYFIVRFFFNMVRLTPNAMLEKCHIVQIEERFLFATSFNIFSKGPQGEHVPFIKLKRIETTELDKRYFHRFIRTSDFLLLYTVRLRDLIQGQNICLRKARSYSENRNVLFICKQFSYLLKGLKGNVFLLSN